MITSYQKYLRGRNPVLFIIEFQTFGSVGTSAIILLDVALIGGSEYLVD